MLEISSNKEIQLCSHAKRLPSSFDLLSGLLKIESYSPYTYYFISHILLYNARNIRDFSSVFFHFELFSTLFLVVVVIICSFVQSLSWPHLKSLQYMYLYLIKSFETEIRYFVGFEINLSHFIHQIK